MNDRFDVTGEERVPEANREFRVGRLGIILTFLTSSCLSSFIWAGPAEDRFPRPSPDEKYDVAVLWDPESQGKAPIPIEIRRVSDGMVLATDKFRLDPLGASPPGQRTSALWSRDSRLVVIEQSSQNMTSAEFLGLVKDVFVPIPGPPFMDRLDEDLAFKIKTCWKAHFILQEWSEGRQISFEFLGACELEDGERHNPRVRGVASCADPMNPNLVSFERLPD